MHNKQYFQITGVKKSEIEKKRWIVVYKPNPPPPEYNFTNNEYPLAYDYFSNSVLQDQTLSFFLGKTQCHLYNGSLVFDCPSTFINDIIAEGLEMVKTVRHYEAGEDKIFIMFEHPVNGIYYFREYTMMFYTTGDDPKVSNKLSYNEVEPSDRTYSIQFNKELFGELRGISLVSTSNLIVFYFKKFSADNTTYQNRVCWLRIGRIHYLLNQGNGDTFDADRNKVCIRINDYEEVF